MDAREPVAPDSNEKVLSPEKAVIAAVSGGGTPSTSAVDGFIQKGTPEFRRAATALFAVGFATFALLYCVQPLMPVIAADFKFTATTSSLVLSVSTVTLAVGLIFTGPISDALGRKPIMVVALIAAALFTLGSAMIPTWNGVLIFRALVGLSLSGIVSVAMTYLSEEIHPQVLGFAMGLYIGGNAIGGMMGRLISGVLVEFISWRFAVGTLGALALVAAIFFWFSLPPSRHFRPTPLRPRAIIDGFKLHLHDAALPWLFFEGFLLMGAFVTLFNYITYRLLAEPYHFSQSVVGSASAVYLTGIYSSARLGSLADKLGRRRILWAIIACMLVGVLITFARPVWLILTGMLIFTFGFFGSHSVVSSWVGRRARQARGQASSLYLLSYYIGSSLAGTIGGLFWHAWSWTGVGCFIASLLAVALAVALWLIRVAPLPV